MLKHYESGLSNKFEIKSDLMRYFLHIQNMENHPFPPILKAEVEFVKWRAEDVFCRAVDWIEGARYPYRRRATHIRGATHIASPALAK